MTSFSDDFKHYLGLLRRWAWLLLLTTLLCGAAAYLVSSQLTPVYQAITTVLINEAPATRTTDYTAIVTSERLAQTYAQLMVKAPVLQGVIISLDLDLTPTELHENILVQPVRDTTLIEVRVEDTDRQRAADIANTLVSEFAEQNRALQSSRYAASKQSLETQLNQLDQQITENNQALADLSNTPENTAERDRLEALLTQYRQTYAYLLQSYEQVRLTEAQSTSNIVQVEPASSSRQPVRPRTMFNTILASLVGLMLAAGTIFLREALDDTLKTPEDINQALGLPVLGVIARHEVREGQPLTTLEPRSPVAEAFRSLRTNIQFASVDRPLRTLLVTSPSPAEGKSTISVNLAIVVAQSERRVTLVDADMRRPRVDKLMGLQNTTGLSNLFVQEDQAILTSLQTTSLPGLAVLTSGDVPPNPSELLGSERMYTIVGILKEHTDLVILDSPPVMAVTDSVLLAPRVDGVLLVIKPNVTQAGAARQCLEQLRRVGAHVLGTVLNDVDLQRYSYQGYYYSAYHGYYRESTKASRSGLARLLPRFFARRDRS